jgi:hypothetical protein
MYFWQLFAGATAGHIVAFALIGVLLALLRKISWIYVVVRLPGTALHEASHYLLGLLLGARPVLFSVRPERAASGKLSLGRVEFAGLSWWNKAPIGLAPLLLLPLAIYLASLACSLAPTSWQALLLMYSSWICLLSSIPSITDLAHVLAGIFIAAIVVGILIMCLNQLGVWWV